MWKSNTLAFSSAWGRCTMASRLQLQTLLESLFEEGEEHVYFQPPPNIQMQYPCIVYKREASLNRYADDKKYLHSKRYQVTVIDRNPDTELSDKVEELPLCEFDRYFPADGLNHYVFTLFF
jgi:hypothetical protein